MCMSVSSCCCLGLDVGAKIISVISVLCSCFTIVLYGVPAVALSDVMESRRLVYALAALCALVQLVINCTLAFGIFKKSPRLIIPWLWTAWVSCGLLLALAVLGSALVLLNYTRDPAVGDEVSGMVSVYFVGGVILYYFASVVSSRRQEMLLEDSTESAEKLMRRYGQSFNA